MDKLSLQRIELMHPWAIGPATNVLGKMEAALKGRAFPRYTYTLRTLKEQQDLYNLGRTKVNPDGKKASKPMGNIVTNAKAGQSIHNYGLAFDIALVIDGKEASWDTVKDWDKDGISDWMECVAAAKSEGFEWGGDWRTFSDQPHFQLDFGYTWQQLQVKYNLGKFMPGTTFVDLNRKPIVGDKSWRTTASVNLRKGPSTGEAVIMVILKGEYVTETGANNGGWTEVLYNGIKGFVSTQYLTK